MASPVEFPLGILFGPDGIEEKLGSMGQMVQALCEMC
jgi:hypothetical protein